MADTVEGAEKETMVAESTWHRDLRVLEIIADADEAHEFTHGGFDAGHVAERAGLSLDDAFHVLDRLERAGYIEVARRSAGGSRRSMRVEAIEERGLRAVGVWPAAELEYSQLLDVLEQLRQDAPPEEQSRWQRLAEGIAGAGREVAVQFVAALAKQSAGLG